MGCHNSSDDMERNMADFKECDDFIAEKGSDCDVVFFLGDLNSRIIGKGKGQWMKKEDNTKKAKYFKEWKEKKEIQEKKIKSERCRKMLVKLLSTRIHGWIPDTDAIPDITVEDFNALRPFEQTVIANIQKVFRDIPDGLPIDK